MSKDWRHSRAVDGWPDWCIEVEGVAIGRTFEVSDAPTPDPVGLPDGAGLGYLLARRAVHAPTGATLEDRWADGAYRRTYVPAPADPDHVDHYADACRVLDGKPRMGRPKGSDLTAERIFDAVLRYRLEQGGLPTLDQAAAVIHCSRDTLRRRRRELGISWRTLGEMVEHHVTTLDALGGQKVADI